MSDYEASIDTETAQAFRTAILDERARLVDCHVENQLAKAESLQDFWINSDLGPELSPVLKQEVDAVLASSDSSIEAFRRWWSTENVQDKVRVVLPFMFLTSPIITEDDFENYYWGGEGKCDVCLLPLREDSVIERRFRKGSWPSQYDSVCYRHCSTCYLVTCRCGAIVDENQFGDDGFGTCADCQKEDDLLYEEYEEHERHENEQYERYRDMNSD